jgi:Fe-S-cluster containining protein
MAIPFHYETVQFPRVSQVDAARDLAAANHRVDGGVGSAEHSCGDCRVCCIHLPIPVGEVCRKAKPAGVACPHLADHGCQIYQDRPATCQKFQCTWLSESSWPLAWRPERSGLLCLREEVDNEVHAALVYEIERDAIARPTTESILARLRESTVVVALVNLQQQRRLLRGHQWVERGERVVRRPHFLKPISAVGAPSPERLSDAS